MYKQASVVNTLLLLLLLFLLTMNDKTYLWPYVYGHLTTMHNVNNTEQRAFIISSCVQCEQSFPNSGAILC